MNTLRKVFVLSALLCAGGWLVKQPAIALTGGEDGESVAVAALWVIGTLGFLVAAGTGAALAGARLPVWLRVLAGVVAAPVAFVALEVLDGAVKSVYPSDGWFRDEVALVLVGVVIGAWGLRVAVDRGPTTAATVAARPGGTTTSGR